MENVLDRIVTKHAKFCNLRKRDLGNLPIGFTIYYFNNLFESSMEIGERTIH